MTDEQKAALDLAVLNLKTHGDDQLLTAIKPLLEFYESRRAAGASEDARDAERYRWLRNEHFPTADNPPLAQVVWKKMDNRHGSQWANMIDGNDLDRAIDDAITKEK